MSSKERFELPAEYETLHIGVGLYDAETGAVLDGNERLERILGYPVGRLRELAVADYTANTYPHSESEFHDRLRESANGQSQQFTWRVKREDGNLIWVQLFMTQRGSGSEHCVHVEMRDITDYYETHHRAELFWRLLRHNLRNEAAIILGYANQLTEHAEREDVADVLETIRSRGENLGNMAESVKEIEHAVTNGHAGRVRRSAAATVRHVAGQIGADYPAAEISINERERMWIDVNDAFGHALTHAVENAIIHSTDDAPAVAIDIGPSPNTGRVEIRIEDTNAEISDEELEALFAPTETTNTSHGSGIGLFVMKWCVESLGGEVAFRTRPSGGNAVSLYLPPKPTPDDTERGDVPPRTT